MNKIVPQFFSEPKRHKRMIEGLEAFTSLFSFVLQFNSIPQTFIIKMKFYSNQKRLFYSATINKITQNTNRQDDVIYKM